MTQLIEDFATLFSTTTTSQTLNTATSAAVTTTSGMAASPHQQRVRLEPAGGSTTQFEIALAQIQDGTHIQFVDPATGTTPSVLGRGLEGTTAQTWPTGSLVTQVITAGGLDNMGPSGTFSPIAVTGLTGATAASRWVGATASGAPTSGTFAVGDFVIDQLGCIHVCRVAGTPGTWTSPTMGTLAYSESSTGGTCTGAELTMVTASAVTVGTGRRIKITSYVYDFAGTVINDAFEMRHKEGATVLGARTLRVATGTPPGGPTISIHTPTAGSHTYYVSLIRTVGTGNLSYGTTYPAFIQVEDVGI